MERAEEGVYGAAGDGARGEDFYKVIVGEAYCPSDGAAVGVPIP